MTHTRVLVLQGISTIRTTSDSELVAALSEEEVRLPRTAMQLDTRSHKESIDSGYWAPVEAQVREFATDVLADLEEHGPAMLLYVGIDEVPTLLALAAFLSDEHLLECRDYDRDQGAFHWPSAGGSLTFESAGVPTETLDMPGDVVLRVELSYPVQSRDVDTAVPVRLADITIRPKGLEPKPGLVRAQADVEEFRREVRDVLAKLERVRPGTQTVHLFVAGPVSACLAVGRELRLRNGKRVQTYRYRTADSPPQTPAILLTPEASSDVLGPLTAEQRLLAQTSRQVWTRALDDIKEHAKTLRNAGAWPFYLAPLLRAANPQPARLDSIWNLVTDSDSIATDDVIEFRFDRSAHRWYLPDRMLLSMNDAAGGDEEKVRRLARAFLWHEYLHEYQYLTENTAINVGGFPNCLERVDYVADVYGTLHQIDFILRQNQVTDERRVIELLRDAITEAIQAFWTFEPRPPTRFWQTRRIRRYLNWYWRRARIIQAKTLAEAMSLLCEPPVIEIAGPAISTDARRIFIDLDRVRQPDALELALVDRNNKLQRFQSGPTLSIAGLLDAFRLHDLDGIDRFFGALSDVERQRA